MKWPSHSDTMEYLKMLFGFCVLAMLFYLGHTIAVGHVEAATSYGLESILTGLFTLAGGFVHWAFGKISEDINKDIK